MPVALRSSPGNEILAHGRSKKTMLPGPRYPYPYIQMPLLRCVPQSEKYNIRNLHLKRLTMKGIDQAEQAGVEKIPQLQERHWRKGRLKGAVWMATLDDDSAKAHIDPDPGPETA
ncbi:hypothetical protein BDV97DRAFT_9710 [Delphinella strobiligena]|nr:hypothetical protein BDV97DRAFT_9710 [Delphinella strobiligena]